MARWAALILLKFASYPSLAIRPTMAGAPVSYALPAIGGAVAWSGGLLDRRVGAGCRGRGTSSSPRLVLFALAGPETTYAMGLFLLPVSGSSALGMASAVAPLRTR